MVGSTEEVFGEWMVAQVSRKGWRFLHKEARNGEGQRKEVKSDKKGLSSSRYAVLEDDDGEEKESQIKESYRKPVHDVGNVIDRKAGGMLYKNQKKTLEAVAEEDAKRNGLKVTGSKHSGKLAERRKEDKQESNKNNYKGEIRTSTGLEMNPTERSELGGKGGNDSGLKGIEEVGLETNKMGIYGDSGVGFSGNHVKGLDDNIMDISLESSPDKVEEAMELDTGRPPDPNKPIEPLGLSEVEVIIQDSDGGGEATEGPDGDLIMGQSKD